MQAPLSLPMNSRRKYTIEAINEARKLYQDGALLAEIKAKTGMGASSLAHYLDGAPIKGVPTMPPIPRRRDVAAKIRRVSTRTSRPALIARLWTTAERQVAEIEMRLGEAGGDPNTLERDARTLAILAKTVRDLVALDAAAKAETDKPHGENDPPRNLDAFRRALAEKLVELGRLELGA